MEATTDSVSTSPKQRTTVQRKSERELVVTRTIDAPARIVFEAWTKAELLQQWWVPQSIGVTLLSCAADVRVGGRYSFVFGHGDAQPMEFFGKYLEVTPPTRLVWTNEESAEGPVTTLTLEENSGKTLVILHDLYPSKEALDAAMASGEKSCMDETFDQLEQLLATLGAS